MRYACALIALGLLVLVTQDRASVQADPAVVGYPNSMAALGDSITQAANSNPFGDQPQNSWATGTNASVNSLYSRILAQNPGISGNNFNLSVSGSRMTHLNGQAAQAVAQGVDLVTVWLGANDVCTSSEATMTPVATFEAQFQAGMQTLTSGLPNARIAVVSIPDIYNLWDILHDNSTATFIWNFYSICQSMLANPTSMAEADVTRRANVRQRNIDFNNVLANVCSQYMHCKFDGYAAFDMVFQPIHVSTIDYFHPSLQGQTLAAQVAWDVAYDFTDVTAPVSSSAGAASIVTLSATDAAGVSGIEYKIGAGAWQTYTAPLPLSLGTMLTWRAVDVNGNVEATKTCNVRAHTWTTGDTDCDGYPDTTVFTPRAPESVIGTDETQLCPTTTGVNDEPLPDAWPPDFNDNQIVNVGDITAFNTPFGQPTTNPPINFAGTLTPIARWDLNGSGLVNVSDVLQLNPFMFKRCA
jgi:lysophospholipase L1-like esterase